MNVSGLGCRYCALLLTHLCLAINLVSIRMLENVGLHAFCGLFPALCGCCVFACYLKAFAYENCVNVWGSFICTGDCCALIKGVRILFWAHVSGLQSCIIWKVNLVRWCKLNADRGDWLCDRQVVGLDGICKLQWDDFLKSFYFLWTPSCVMAQMWRDRMQCRYVLGVCRIMKVLVYVICVSLYFC